MQPQIIDDETAFKQYSQIKTMKEKCPNIEIITTENNHTGTQYNKEKNSNKSKQLYRRNKNGSSRCTYICGDRWLYKVFHHILMNISSFFHFSLFSQFKDLVRRNSIRQQWPRYPQHRPAKTRQPMFGYVVSVRLVQEPCILGVSCDSSGRRCFPNKKDEHGRTKCGVSGKEISRWSTAATLVDRQTGEEFSSDAPAECRTIATSGCDGGLGTTEIP